ncbi:FHA domain-containing protein [uncultured Corynebacterium sp.]|uniref:FHA domain-containing protein n=1 Tax=uncultured Corynebacterium sp. TaxID=159447 RepID=UPI0025986F0C|nr:FHA domain-containing protein [uncultured Corynebacterium sp.]
MGPRGDDQHPKGAAHEAETTAVFRADFLDELHDASTTPSAAHIEGLTRAQGLLVVKRGPNAGSRFLLDRPLTTAGRHPASDIFLDDATVSRRHAEFRLDQDSTCTVVDIGSLNGTYVNRQPVDAAVLADSDEVQIGKFRLIFMMGSSTRDS